MRQRLTIIAVLALALSLSIGAPAGAKAKKPVRKPPRAQKLESRVAGGFQPAVECAKCHTDTYRNWQGSLHAASFTNPIFQAAWYKAYVETKGEGSRACLGCHAPVAAATGDHDMKNEISREGITCDFCHSVAGVNPQASPTFDLKPGAVKRSALKDPRAEGHQAEYSKDFASSRLCAGCHDFTNSNGAHVGRTYDEWKQSSYAKEDTMCQSCHMPLTAGSTANSGGREKIHDHSLSHSYEGMKDAIVVETKNASRMGDELLADVTVHNLRAGHAVPTGTPARGLVLEVSTVDTARRTIETKKIVYRKVVTDDKGKELTSDGDAFLYGKRLMADNRLAPDEKRNETFRFTQRLKDVAGIAAQAYFFYQPFVLQQVEMRVPLSESAYPVK